MTDHRIRIGCAPVSWGVFGNNLDDPNIPKYSQVMDEIALAGYAGTELGPYGYYPLDVDTLGSELGKRSLQLASSFVPVELQDPAGFEVSTREVMRVGHYLKNFRVQHIIVSATWSDERVKISGSVPPDGSRGWNPSSMQAAAQRLDELGGQMADELGMSLVFHSHAGTWIETEEEIDSLLELTDPALTGLCLDTGHIIYGGGDPIRLIYKWGERVQYVHFKDVWPDKLAQVRKEKIDANTAWQMGVFSRLGEGCVDFKGVMKALQSNNYGGWIIVEQDIVQSPYYRSEQTPFECAQFNREFIRNVLGY